MTPVSGRVLATYAFVAILFISELCVAELPPNYTFVHEATEAPSISFYDYIVIGGGTTGIPIATTLSKKYKVLLLERGGSPYTNPNITNISGFGSMFLDPSPDSPSQKFTVEGVINTRGRVLGGGTSINAGLYSRGEQQFLDEANLSDENLIYESYQWVEDVMVFEPVVGNWQTALKAALIEGGVTPDNGFSLDHIIGSKVGGSIFDPNGTRHTAADLLQYANPENLLVLLHATVQKIKFDTQGRSRPVAYGVTFLDASGRNHTAFLKGRPKSEIILSAGAFGSPVLLMLSGVGPKEQLEAYDIKVVLDQPLVGKKMADNPLNTFFIPSPIPVEPSLVQVCGITEFGTYIQALGSINLLLLNSSYEGFDPAMGGFVYEKVNGPESFGELTFNESLNPSDNPRVSFNYFTAPNDLIKCEIGLRTILKAIETNAFSSYMYANMTAEDIVDLNMRLQVSDNTTFSYEVFCKEAVRTVWHYHGGCRIGEVVDDEYKVFGVDALRVIDGSTLLNSPGTNPQASLMMLGRYMGVKILGQHLSLHQSQ